MSARTRRIWTGIVNYANSPPDAIDITELRRTLANWMPWYVATDWLSPVLFPGRGDLFLAAAQRYQPSLQALLRWFVSAKPNERGSLFQQAYGFLLEHVDHIKWRLVEVDYPQNVAAQLNELYSGEDFERFKEESERYWSGWEKDDSPLGILAPAKGYKDLADPICDFLLSEYHKFRSREFSRRDKEAPRPVPIIVCPSCNKLVMPERVGRRKFCIACSDKGRAKRYEEKASPHENSDYQWLYRLRKLDLGVRKVALRNPKKLKRLKLIKANQQTSPRCQRLILEMGLHEFPARTPD